MLLQEGRGCQGEGGNLAVLGNFTIHQTSGGMSGSRHE
jgi:hypothetical protein